MNQKDEKFLREKIGNPILDFLDSNILNPNKFDLDWLVNQFKTEHPSMAAYCTKGFMRQKLLLYAEYKGLKCSFKNTDYGPFTTEPKNIVSQSLPNDTLNYLELVIIKALPTSLIDRVDNYDDFYSGYDIYVLPGSIIRFQFTMDNPMKLCIQKTEIPFIWYATENPQAKRSIIFNGTVPSNENYEPDYDFLVKLLQNYKSIG